MNRARHGAIALFAAALTLGANVARADEMPTVKQWQVVGLGEVFSAFQTICQAHPGDEAAQVAAAQGPAYKFVESDAEPDGTRTFWNGRLLVRVNHDADTKLCMVRGRVDPATKLADGQKAAQPALGEPKSVADDNIVWLGPMKPRMTVYAFVLGEADDVPIAGYVTGTR